MSIVRGHKQEDGWFILPNHAVRDRRLSLKAVGLLAHLLSHEPGWKVNSIALAKHWQVGRDQIRNALAELEAFGYVIRVRWQNDRGHWQHDLVVFDNPQAHVENPASYPLPTPDPPVVGTSGHIRRTNKEPHVGVSSTDTLKVEAPLCGRCGGSGLQANGHDTLIKCGCNGGFR